MKKLIVPLDGKKVRDLITGRHIPAAGLNRQIDSYLSRRIADGDIEIREEKPKKTKKADSTNSKTGD